MQTIDKQIRPKAVTVKKKNNVNQKNVEIVEKMSYNKDRLGDIFARKIIELRKVANELSPQ